MTKFNTQQITFLSDYSFLGQWDNLYQVKQFDYHSQQVQKDSCFFALNGAQSKGYQWLEEAYQKGAIVFFCEQEDYAWVKQWIQQRQDTLLVIFCSDVLDMMVQLATQVEQRQNMIRIGITGSNGKTTTKQMLSAVLEQAQIKYFATKGNQNTVVSIAHLWLNTHFQDIDVAVFEAGINHFGEMEQLEKLIDPHLGILTNIGSAHIGFFGSQETIAQEKIKLFKNMSRDDQVFMLSSDLWARKMSKHLQASIQWIKEEDLFIDRESFHEAQPSMRFCYQGHHFQLNMSGEHNLYNALLVIALARALKIDFLPIAQGLKNTAMAPYRMEWFFPPVGACQVLLDCYNASYESYQNFLDYLERTHKNSMDLFLVLAPMRELGTYEKDYHDQLMKKIEKLQIKKIYFLDPLWTQFVGSYSGSYQIYSQLDKLLEQIQPLIESQTKSLVAVKGSNFYQLWKIKDLFEKNRKK